MSHSSIPGADLVHTKSRTGNRGEEHTCLPLLTRGYEVGPCQPDTPWQKQQHLEPFSRPYQLSLGETRRSDLRSKGLIPSFKILNFPNISFEVVSIFYKMRTRFWPSELSGKSRFTLRDYIFYWHQNILWSNLKGLQYHCWNNSLCWTLMNETWIYLLLTSQCAQEVCELILMTNMY